MIDRLSLPQGVKDYIPAEGADTPGSWTITDSAGGISNATAVAESPAGTYDIDYVAIATGVAKFKYLDPNFKFEVNFESLIS